MCGIFGLVVSENGGFKRGFIRDSLTTLAHLSADRGKDTSGFAFRNTAAKEFHVLKGAVSIHELLARKEVASEMDSAVESFYNGPNGSSLRTFAAMGHSRLVTNGSQLRDVNNQPVIKDGLIGVHNGIIVNDSDLWKDHPEISRDYEIDTEVMLALVRKYLREDWSIDSAISKTINETFGTVSAAFFLEDQDTFALATNNGSLYVLTDEKDFLAFASEEYFLKKLASEMRLDSDKGFSLKQVSPYTGLTIDLKDFTSQPFSFAGEAKKQPSSAAQHDAPYQTHCKSVTNGTKQRELVLNPTTNLQTKAAQKEQSLLEFNIEQIKALRRCSKCLLPETFPYIEYDASGECNYCKNYRRKCDPKPIEELLELVEPYRSSTGGYDCIVPFSGGRDSTYTLHLVKNLLKLNPIAFTYDWGMVNDLGRRNIARVCGKLGVENIIVSANIHWKRENIRKNILAWLRRPTLGMIPLFMAGDKYFYYYTDQIKKRTGVSLNIWGVNPLENTEFKVGFLGVPPDHKKKRIYSLSVKRQAKLFYGVGKNILTNPKYINGSNWDTLGSFFSRSIAPHRDYYHFFDYYRWDETEIEELVKDEYRWETAPDTKTTWRIGDGTASFYNYIYYTVAGFSEHDTFRSNQIREGMLTREEALKLVMEENKPRYPSIKWYTDILNLDFSSTIKVINQIPKLYPAS